MNICVTGTGITRFGELWGESVESLANSAALEALEEAHASLSSIDCLIVSNMLVQQLESRAHVGALVAQSIGYLGETHHVEAACASGGVAIRQAVSLLQSGMAKKVLVLGVEKMTDARSEEISQALMAAGGEDEQMVGATFPTLYALVMREYLKKYNTVKEKDVALASVQSHMHGMHNPLAQFHSRISIDDVMKSPIVSSPIRQLMCSPISDGAAAVVLEKKENTKGCVSIIGTGQGGDTLSLARRKTQTSFLATQHAYTNASTMAGIGTTDIQLVELHDCFSIAHILALEDMGFAQFGKGTGFLKKNTRLSINTSGGLKACGHPIGATGVKQIVEITRQLNGVCGKRQVKNARVGVAHNVGGTGATAVVHILRREDGI